MMIYDWGQYDIYCWGGGCHHAGTDDIYMARVVWQGYALDNSNCIVLYDSSNTV